MIHSLKRSSRWIGVLTRWGRADPTVPPLSSRPFRRLLPAKARKQATNRPFVPLLPPLEKGEEIEAAKWSVAFIHPFLSRHYRNPHPIWRRHILLVVGLRAINLSLRPRLLHSLAAHPPLRARLVAKIFTQKILPLFWTHVWSTKCN